ncbi:glycosyl hydrolase [Prevotella sp. 10(H)]|uniref:glycosyl hydrolase n=1 Tax=Prevotella sp. 10(H) TaxID=1158294 RepID=UPI0004A6F253|nr:glycosyl hydrolase [Prevotella sp. 10(H)]
MKRVIALQFFLLFFLFFPLIHAQSQKYKGYPEKNADILSGFTRPPKGYGNVPFYWWNGDSLNRERMKEQLEILSEAAIDGFAVSYIHMDTEVDIEEMKDGYGLYGKTEPGRPKVFSEDWWNIWSWFAKECASKNIGLGMDDYTVGWIGNGYYTDEVLEKEKFKNYKGELDIISKTAQGGTTFAYNIPEKFLVAVAWPEKIDLTQYISGGKLVWKIPEGKNYNIYIISTKDSHYLHPDIGKEYVNVYFDRFEKKMGDAVQGGMNYFFQDELSYPIKMGSWSEDFKEEFVKRKGYDITLYLPALKYDIGDITPKIRLDYCDVLMDLAEERYFRPIYDWHASRGLIYGSDNLGRGMEPLAYVDYFRANSWYTAPGNDAPSTGSSFLQTKVSSSIAHLYDRPRTWLEAFHSMGWGSSGSWLTRQMDHHFMAGGNLVCMHGLYYSTHGGWWEWAPPCFHFRMPYWPHIKKWLKYTERLSYLMSQGNHVCDIALMYPTESMQAYPNADANIAFNQAVKLSNAGLDYDFLDYRSLQQSKVENGTINIAGEKYRILILADMKAMHHASLQKVLEFYQSGGIVLATGDIPKASTHMGENDPEVDKIIHEIFGLTAREAIQRKSAVKQVNNSNGMGIYLPDSEMASEIWKLITPDFKPTGGVGKVLHRHIGERDVYMVMDVPKGTECFFRAKGKVELWNASDGSISDYPVVRQTEEGTWLLLEKEPDNSYLFVFSPGTPTKMLNHKKEQKLVYNSPITGFWETELLPTLDNKWGDYRFPPSGIIGAEARSFKHQPAVFSPQNWMHPDFDDSQWPESIYGFGPQFVSELEPSENPLVNVEKEADRAKDILEFSWQYGVFDNPGSQGWHGLKGKVSDGFFILDKGAHQIYRTMVYAPQKDNYRIEVFGTEPDYLSVDKKVASKKILLDKGWHQLVVAYAKTQQNNYKLRKGAYRDFRDRSAVVFFPESSPTPKKLSPYDKIISTRWGIGNHLLYDPYGGENLQWNYRFHSVPGMEEMEMTIAGSNLKIWFNGKEINRKNIRLISSNASGISTYKVVFPNIQKEAGLVAFSINRKPGYQGAGAISEPIRIKTGKGVLEAGNWSETGALKYYSGGMYYRKKVSIPQIEKGYKIILDLGEVNASCEVKINGKDAGIVMSSPYQIDISKYAETGDNDIDILVYSTLSNHYQTIPTPYRGDAIAGLLGPVSLSVIKAE